MQALGYKNMEETFIRLELNIDRAKYFKSLQVSSKDVPTLNGIPNKNTIEYKSSYKA